MHRPMEYYDYFWPVIIISHHHYTIVPQQKAEKRIEITLIDMIIDPTITY
jgi:hypothetical protein